MTALIRNVILLSVILASLPSLTLATPDSSIKLEIYNPQNNSIFPTTSTLIQSCDGFEPELILFDAQFMVTDGENLLAMINETGKPLKKIVITCGDPDYYFGLQPIVEAYPDVEIISSARTAERIRSTKDAKLAYWGPVLEEEAPKELYEPTPTTETNFTIANETIEMRSVDEYAAYVWMPGQKAIWGGVGVFWNMHVWVADNPTEEDRDLWRKVLREMIELEPKSVIPGHFVDDFPGSGDDAVRFTLEYLENFERILKENKEANSTVVIEAMMEEYPELHHEQILQLGAKVVTGEALF